MIRILALAALAVALAAPAALASDRADTGALEQRVQSISSELRCPVCQNLSVWDSPSQLAHSMRLRIRQLVRSGASDDEVRRYFVDRYGEWILLEPPRSGIGLWVWIAPAVLLALGAAAATVAVRRWRARAAVLADVDPQALARAEARLDELESAGRS